MIIWRIQPLANDHPEDPATCKWSFGGTGHLQMIIQRIRPLANDHPEDLASCKWSSGGTGLLQMIIRHPRHPNHLSQDPDSISRTFLEQFAPVLFTPSLLSTKFYKICMIHNNKLQNLIPNHNLQRSCLEFSKSCPEHKFGKMFFGSKISKRKSPDQQFVISFFFAGFSIC